MHDNVARRFLTNLGGNMDKVKVARRRFTAARKRFEVGRAAGCSREAERAVGETYPRSASGYGLISAPRPV